MGKFTMPYKRCNTKYTFSIMEECFKYMHKHCYSRVHNGQKQLDALWNMKCAKHENMDELYEHIMNHLNF